jgi:hypothetical protein
VLPSSTITHQLDKRVIACRRLMFVEKEEGGRKELKGSSSGFSDGIGDCWA